MIGIEASYPLTPLQAGMLFNTLYAADTGVDVVQAVVRLDDEPDLVLLQAAWRAVVAHHAVLRTGFRWMGLDRPVQDVYITAELPVVTHDWRAGSLDDFDRARQRFVESDRAAGVDLSLAGTTRLAVLCGPAHTVELVWTYHHALLDGRSRTRVLGDVFEWYECLRRGDTPSLSAAPAYRGFVEWLDAQDASRGETHWRALLRGVEAPVSLLGTAVGGPRPVHTNYRWQRDTLSRTLTRELAEFAAGQGVSVNVVLQAAWAILLSKYNDAPDVIFGSVRAGRRNTITDADGLVGLVINTVPVRVSVPPDAQVGPWLHALARQDVAARAVEHTPLTVIQSWSEVASGTPLFDTLLVVEKASADVALRQRASHWGRRHVTILSQSNYAVSLGVELDDELRLTFTHSTASVAEEDAQRALAHFRHLIAQLVTMTADEPLSAVSLLSTAERQQVVTDWNAATITYSPETRVLDPFEAWAARTPEAAAVIGAAVGDMPVVTYGELDRRANQLAHDLRRRGVGPEVSVGVCLERSVNLIVALLGILKAGGVFVPLDPSYPTRRLSFMLGDARVKVLLTQVDLRERLPSDDAVVSLCLDAEARAIEQAPTNRPIPRSTPAHLAYILYTSGSTGTPKGVAMSHQALVNVLAWQTERSEAANYRTLQFASAGFDVFMQEVFGAFCTGAALVLISDLARKDPAALLEVIRRHEVERAFMPPVMLQQLAEAVQRERESGMPGGDGRLSRLRQVVCAGEALYVTPVIRAMFQDVVPSATLHNQYGPTESLVITEYVLRPPFDRWVDRPPIGRALANSQCYVLDRETQPVPVGVPGELYLGGYQIARGYAGRPGHTAERFVPDPFDSNGTRLYRTGDRVRWGTGGEIEFLGRIDNQIKLRGYRIELGEIEAVLGQQPGIGAAVAVIREDRPGDRQLVAYVTARGAETLNLDAVRKELSAQLPPYAVPAVIIELDAMPMTANAKVDRAALPAPTAERREELSGSETPRTPLERHLATVWAEVLGVSQPGLADDFFESGGDSLRGAIFCNRLQAMLDERVYVTVLFETRTLGQLAQHLAEQYPAATACLAGDPEEERVGAPASSP